MNHIVLRDARTPKEATDMLTLALLFRREFPGRPWGSQHCVIYSKPDHTASWLAYYTDRGATVVRRNEKATP